MNAAIKSKKGQDAQTTARTVSGEYTTLLDEQNAELKEIQ